MEGYKVPLRDLISNGLWYLWTEPENRPCLMPDENGKAACVIVFTSKALAESYLKNFIASENRHYPIKYLPLNRSMETTLRAWVKQWPYLQFPFLKDGEYIGQIFSIEDLLWHFEKAQMPRDGQNKM